MLTTIIGPIFLLGIVIFAHELSHFLMAKLYKVKILKFSIGFGPALWRRKLGETEYQVAAFPLGGFVKMHGENPEEKDQDPRSYLNKPIPQRMMIVLAGPLGNLGLPILALTLMFWSGVPELAPRIQRVEPMTLAAQRGLRAGDTIVEVGREKVNTWGEIEDDFPLAGTVKVTVSREGAELLKVELPVEEFKNLSPYPYEPLVGVIPGSAAEETGFRMGDKIQRVGADDVRTWEDFRIRLEKAKYPLDIALDRDGTSKTITVQSDLNLTGLDQPELYVSKILPGSPAEKAGLRAHDKVLEFGGQPVYRWPQLVELIQTSEGKTIELTVLRGTDVRRISVRVESATIEEPTGDSKKVGRIGIQPLVSLAEPETVFLKSGPVEGMLRGIGKTAEITLLHVKVMANLFRGKVSMKNIGGPILIIKAASSSAKEGMRPYLMMLSFISVGLAIINLFPIPLLDGGQMLLLAVEGIRRKPLSLRALEILQQAGLVLLLTMMVFAFYNDVMRDRETISHFFQRFLDFFKG